MGREFVYGAATSAHQVEGNNLHNQWWAWEQLQPEEKRSGKAADHFARYEEDFALAKSLGHSAHRLSIEWSRIEPRRNEWDRAAIAHYRAVLRALQAQGLQSFVTLSHFTIPQWLAEQGGWVSRDAVDRFLRYVRLVAEELGDLVDVWITLNEPVLYALMSYWRGVWPPQERNLFTFLWVIRQLERVHRRTYRLLHGLQPEAKVGIAQNLIAFAPARGWHPGDRAVSRLADWWYNHRFWQQTAGTHDFLGVNYYYSSRLALALIPPGVHKQTWRGAVTDLGWAIDPAGLKEFLVDLRRYNLPVYITENGIADAADSNRPSFIREHLRVIHEARQAGADVRGYFYWSLLDGFEWEFGHEPRFGLVAVDFATGERSVRASAHALRFD